MAKGFRCSRCGFHWVSQPGKICDGCFTIYCEEDEPSFEEECAYARAVTRAIDDGGSGFEVDDFLGPTSERRQPWPAERKKDGGVI